MKNFAWNLLTILVITCIMLHEMECGRWTKLNTWQVCFGAKDNSYGSFRQAGRGALVGALMLSHRSGRVRCSKAPIGDSRWGCHGLWGNVLNIVVTDAWNRVIFPKPQFVVHWKGMYYYLPGIHELKSKRLVFTDFCTPFFLPKKEELRIWYGEDFTNWTEENNHGRVCVDVYAKFIY